MKVRSKGGSFNPSRPSSCRTPPIGTNGAANQANLPDIVWHVALNSCDEWCQGPSKQSVPFATDVAFGLKNSER